MTAVKLEVVIEISAGIDFFMADNRIYQTEQSEREGVSFHPSLRNSPRVQCHPGGTVCEACVMKKTDLFVIIAREASVAVIFRRGPSRQILLIKWNMEDDTFEAGQWFRGNIYEHRSDLSPKGDLLVYSAVKHSRHSDPFYCWTAISKPPYFTALALWPDSGIWGGGGLFGSEDTVLMNHHERELAEGFELKKLAVLPFAEHPHQDMSEPIYHARLLREGWMLKQQEANRKYTHRNTAGWHNSALQVYHKCISHENRCFVLRMQLNEVREQPQGDWCAVDHEIFDEKDNSLLKLPRTSWADWDSNVDLLFAEQGKLFRLPWNTHEPFNKANAKELADFSSLKFEAKEAPDWAKRW
jgi:hypothetical protein